MSARWLWLCLLAWASIVPAARPPQLSDLALIEVPASNPGAARTAAFAILLTGDGGWASIDRVISAELAASGIPVVGFDSLHYFWKERTPKEAANDIARTVNHYTQAWSRQHVILIGYSLGADVLPSIVNRLPADVLEHVCSIALIGLGHTAVYEVQIKHWFPGSKLEGKPVAPELARLPHAQVLCLYGADEPDSLCPSLAGTEAKIGEIGNGHHLGGQYREIAHRIVAASRC